MEGWIKCIWKTLICWVLLRTIRQCAVVGRQHNRYPDMSQEDRLIKHLIKKYEHRGLYGRPVLNFKDIIKVRFGIQLIQIMDLDERNQVLTINVWVTYNWTDVHLRWNVSEYGGVDKLRIPSHIIWTPDIKLYNYADLRLSENRDANIIVKHTGEIEWLPQAVYKSTCKIDASSFPFDQQTCHLKFGSWTYDGFRLELNFNGPANISLADYEESNAWEIISTPAKRNIYKYECCPEPFYDLTFYLVLRRRATFYSYILILPCVLLTSLTLVLFWIPPESPAKMQLGMTLFMAFFLLLILFEGNLPPSATSVPVLGMTLFMAFFLLLLLFEENLPPSATSVPVLGTYYCLNMVLITMSSFICVFVVNLTFFGARAPVPACLKKAMFSCVAKVLCMENIVAPFLEENTLPKVPYCHNYVGVNGDNKWANDWRGSTEVTDCDQTAQNPQLTLLNSKVTEIRSFIRMYKERLEDKDRKERVTKEWKALALIFDRIFFLFYLVTITVSISIVLGMITAR